jgi:NAD(P)-dependent dehydrogenase (short-subunit alcohol dehydrogenase family)
MNAEDIPNGGVAEPGTPPLSEHHPVTPSPIAPGRVAVVTGAASGIGLGLAERFAAEGMSVVMADVEEPALAKAAAGLAARVAKAGFANDSGSAVLPVVTDVSDRAAVDALRDAALSAFGAVHVVCNNAGVGGPHGPLWECPPGEWDWVLKVNLDGVMNGVRAFMPVLLEQDAGHLVNTSSIFGVFAGTLGPYGVSKHAVTALTETLHFNLRSLGVMHVGVSVLCPGAVRTNFGTSARNRPAWAGPATIGDAAEQASAERFDQLSVLGASPAEVAGMVVDGIRARRFYILTSDNRHEPVLRRGEEIVAGGPPAPPVSFV